VSVIAALPFTGIPHLRFSANAEPDAGLECFQGTSDIRTVRRNEKSDEEVDNCFRAVGECRLAV
jgi:hypothetical protein